MTMPHVFDAYLGPLKTKMGACFPGDRAVFRGKDLHRDIFPTEWIKLYVFSITGREFADPVYKILNSTWTVTSYPDPRLWNNRVAALAASTRSTVALANAAAFGATEARIFGWIPAAHIGDFFIRARTAIANGEKLLDLLEAEKAKRHLGGYGRPVATKQGDERIPFILEQMAIEGIEQGEYLKLAFAIEKTLAGTKTPLNMTYMAFYMAVLLDFGFSLRECLLYVLPSTSAGFAPCIIDAADRPAGATFPLCCEQIKYTGQAERSWGA